MEHYEEELAYWGDCSNTFNEDIKHYIYGKHMGLTGSNWNFDLNNTRVIDIGGGPTSMLLKCRNLKQGLVVDPIAYPKWTIERYNSRNIQVQIKPAEKLTETGWDEVWLYNVLQHTEDPELIISLAKRAAPVLRIFEWIDIPPHPGHPHMLTQANMEKWVGSTGTVTQHHGENECYGRSWSCVVVQTQQ
jgi:hypothetical protein